MVALPARRVSNDTNSLQSDDSNEVSYGGFEIRLGRNPSKSC